MATTVARVIAGSLGVNGGAPGPLLTGLEEGTVVKVFLDKPHPQFIFAEILCGAKGGAAAAGVGHQGWVPTPALLVATALTTTFAYAAGSGDEVSFNARAPVYGFHAMDGWWDGYAPDANRAGLFPGNYVTIDAPQPSFLKLPPLTPALPLPPPAPAYTHAPPPPAYTPPPGAPLAAANPMLKASAPAAAPPAAAAPAAAARPAPGSSSSSSSSSSDGRGGGKKPERPFKGELPQQFAVWGHHMALYAAFTLFWCGLFTALWADGAGWACQVDGDWIHGSLIVNTTFPGCESKHPEQQQQRRLTGGAWQPLQEAAASRRELAQETSDDECCEAGLGGGACCNPRRYATVELAGSRPLGLYGVGLSLLVLLLEHADWGFGLWQPSDTLWHRKGVSPLALFYALASLPLCLALPNAFAAVCLVITAGCQQWSFKRFESGDGGRRDRQAAAERAKAAHAKKQAQTLAAGQKAESEYPLDWYKQDADLGWVLLHPVQFLRKLHQEDKLSSALWLSAYFAVNVFIFFFTLSVFEELIDGVLPRLKDGTLDLTTAAHRNAVRFGFLSRAAPWAKASGGCLNFNCALIAMPVTKLLLARLNNLGKSYSKMQAGSSVMSQYFGRFFAHPFTRYVPLSKNVEFHKIIAKVVFFFAWLHTIMHFANYTLASQGTLAIFEKFGWGGTTFLTGFVILLSMFFIYSAASPAVKNAKFENFFFSHHWFIVFFFVLLLHGPVFWCWSLVPLSLYAVERALQSARGGRAFVVTQVEWISPVLAVKLCPVDKAGFNFREGQYLYLNCPFISKHEWHPFTISSARGDLSIPGSGVSNPLRVAVETGEEVTEVPRPAGLDPRQKWAKYCPLSRDARTLAPWQLLAKHETCFHDYVSCHVKVHGLGDAKARTWTRKLKEYVELLCPGQTYPYHFSRRDERGELQLGRRFGVDPTQPILRVDGPHSAPAEHYVNYKTVMLIGAGIGMTPCASVLTAMLKYRWRFGQPPEKLHFYWVVQHNEVDAFQWFVHLVAELEHEHFKQRARAANSAQAARDWHRYYCEIHVFVTRAPEAAHAQPLPPMVSPPKFVPPNEECKPAFTADALYQALMAPTVPSRQLTESMRSVANGPTNGQRPPNNLQDVWVWKGRPDWEQVFAMMQQQAVDPDIGVFFCGAAVIGADLRAMCQKHTGGGVTFSLHKENF